MVMVMMCEGQCCQGEAAVTPHLPILEWRGASASLALASSEYISTKLQTRPPTSALCRMLERLLRGYSDRMPAERQVSSIFYWQCIVLIGQ